MKYTIELTQEQVRALATQYLAEAIKHEVDLTEATTAITKQNVPARKAQALPTASRPRTDSRGSLKSLVAKKRASGVKAYPKTEKHKAFAALVDWTSIGDHLRFSQIVEHFKSTLGVKVGGGTISNLVAYEIRKKRLSPSYMFVDGKVPGHQVRISCYRHIG